MTSDDTKEKTPTPSEKAKQVWQPMKLRYTGEAKELIQHGLIKRSNNPGDPGDSQKNAQHG